MKLYVKIFEIHFLKPEYCPNLRSSIAFKTRVLATVDLNVDRHGLTKIVRDMRKPLVKIVITDYFSCKEVL